MTSANETAAKHFGRGGMGNHKHGVSGKSGPSPRTKFMTCFDANRLADEEASIKRKPAMWRTVKEAITNG